MQNLPTALCPSLGFRTPGPDGGLSFPTHGFFLQGQPSQVPGMPTAPPCVLMQITPRPLLSPHMPRTKLVPLVHICMADTSKFVCAGYIVLGSAAFLYLGSYRTLKGHYSSYARSLTVGFVALMISLCLGEMKMEREVGVHYPQHKHIFINLLCHALRHLL